MRRKLTVRFIAVTVIALVIAGVVSLALARWHDRESDRKELASQVQGLTGQGDQQAARAALPLLRRALRLRDAELLVFGPDGALTNGEMPDGFEAKDLNLDDLRANKVESGVKNGRVYAAAALDRAVRRPAAPRATPVVLLTRSTKFDYGRVLAHQGIAAVLALVVAVVVASQLSRRLAAPVAASEDSTAESIGPSQLRERVDLRMVVAETVAGYEPVADSLGIAIDYEPANSGPPEPVAADPDRLARIVGNLVENALKFAEADVRVRVEPKGRLVVDDDGPDSPRDEAVAVVDEPAAAIGAQIRAESLPRGGRRFVVILQPADGL